MIISSPIKDYYDYVAHLYGGGDPKIIYPRVRLAERSETGIMGIRYISGYKKIPPRYVGIKGKYEGKWLAIAGKYYLLVRTHYLDQHMVLHETPWSVYIPGKIKELDEILLSRSLRWDRLGNKTYEYYVGRPDKELVEISREVRAPVFCIDRDGIEGDVPILGELGIPSIISAEQMYQDLSYFMGNIINEVPDSQPESKPPLTDKERAVAHGFDAKISFRHRKG